MADTLVEGKPAKELTLAELNAVLKSDGHYRRTPTRNYGERDPLGDLTGLLFRCTCGRTPALHRGQNPPQAALDLLTDTRNLLGLARERDVYWVACVCGRHGPASGRGWRAVIDWNYSRAAVPASLSGFPFFPGTATMPPAQAVAYIEAIRYDLELRRLQAKRRREAGEEVGPRFMANLDAYAGWANIALKVLRTWKGPK